jgi:hypothetical protein
MPTNRGFQLKLLLPLGLNLSVITPNAGHCPNEIHFPRVKSLTEPGDNRTLKTEKHLQQLRQD